MASWKKIITNCKIISSVICWLVFPAGIVLIFIGNNFFEFFIKDQINLDFKLEVLVILIVGTIINLLWMVPYTVQLASGLTIIPLVINLIFVPITLLFTWFGFNYYGILSGPIIYLIYNNYCVIVIFK